MEGVTVAWQKLCQLASCLPSSSIGRKITRFYNDDSAEATKIVGRLLRWRHAGNPRQFSKKREPIDKYPSHFHNFNARHFALAQFVNRTELPSFLLKSGGEKISAFRSNLPRVRLKRRSFFLCAIVYVRRWQTAKGSFLFVSARLGWHG